MRNDLNGLPEIIAAAFVGEDCLVDLAAGEIVLTGQDTLGEALIMTEIEVGLRTISQNIDLSVLERIHRSRIDIEVGIELLKRHPQASALQKSSE